MRLLGGSQEKKKVKVSKRAGKNALTGPFEGSIGGLNRAPKGLL
jgi:hypothetical protein